MAAPHRSVERFEQSHHSRLSVESDERHGRNAALIVAVLAAFLAVATFLANEAVKHVITEETHRADASAQLETNQVKIDVAEGNATLLRVLSAETPQERRAAIAAARHDLYVAQHLKPEDARLAKQIQSHEVDTDHANDQHINFELAEVGLEVGIVLASVSIIAGRRWLLVGAGAAASAGVLLLLVGLVLT